GVTQSDQSIHRRTASEGTCGVDDYFWPHEDGRGPVTGAQGARGSRDAPTRHSRQRHKGDSLRVQHSPSPYCASGNHGISVSLHDITSSIPLRQHDDVRGPRLAADDNFVAAPFHVAIDGGGTVGPAR